MFKHFSWYAQKRFLSLMASVRHRITIARQNDMQAYIADFDLDPSQVGRLVAQGRQHMVYRYKTNLVIKIPQQSLYMRAYGGFTYHDILKELAILQEHVPDFIPETHILSTRKHDGYVIVQAFLPHVTFATRDNLQCAASDLRRLMVGYRAIMQKYGLSLDLLGNKGLQQSLIASLTRQKERALMNNILLSKQVDGCKFYIVDFNLLHVEGKPGEITVFRWIIDRICFALSAVLMKDNFDLSL